MSAHTVSNRMRHSNREDRAMIHLEPTVRAVALACAVALAWLPPAAGAEPRTFETPEQALEAMRSALVSAVDNGTADPLLELVGEEYKDALIGSDEAASADNRANALQNFEAHASLEPDGEDRRVLTIGEERWPVPIPMVRADGAWFWDMSGAVEEILNRRIGANERNAIEVLEAYVDAQRQYAWQDRDVDQVREYAQQIISAPGARDGLYWEDVDGEPLSPFGPLVAEARGYQPGRERGAPYFGYYFKVLTRQGADAAGGSYDYVINGNMIGGFAMIAFPAEYGYSGIMSFIVNQRGVVYEKDLGESSTAVGEAIDTYDPGPGWEPVN